MRRKRKIQETAIFFLCLSLLTGCGRTERVKTVVLPDPVEVQEAEDARTDDYEVQKIYTWEYAAPTPGSASLLGCGEHEMRVASIAEDGIKVRFDQLDYRYGFYETYGNTGMERLAIYDWQEAEDIRFLRNALSPDCRFLLWLDNEGTSIGGSRLHLNNLETGEDTLLLDGDVLKCSREEYFPLAGWSRDGRYLAYCFFPKSEEVYIKNEEPLVSVLDLETKEIVGQCSYAYNKGLEGNVPFLEETELYLDVADDKVLLVVATDQSIDGMTRLEICKFGIQGNPEAEQYMDYVTAMTEIDVNIYPDAETNGIYVGRGFDWVYRLDADTGSYGEDALMYSYDENGETFAANRANKFLVLDQEETMISTELAETGEDICIYRKKGEKWERRILYHYNAGALTSLEYDEKNHRLLAISSSSYRYGANQTAIILEF